IGHSNYRSQHPTQKPVELMEYLIKTYTNKNDTVLDFCMGSGTTGVACKKLNRKFIGIELDKEYFQIARKRIKSIPVQIDLF
ncbi:MAG: site-specific DNA-methyltransferase, partial [Herbaspirillum sp.]|uniref:DNA-methyltransferase n=1 Tax=Herbaspirillum sp. TaxID=1890675 RepID=UPI002589E0B5